MTEEDKARDKQLKKALEVLRERLNATQRGRQRAARADRRGGEPMILFMGADHAGLLRSRSF
jgi:hypothetical protein